MLGHTHIPLLLLPLQMSLFLVTTNYVAASYISSSIKNKPSGFWQSRDFKYCVNTEREYIYIFELLLLATIHSPPNFYLKKQQQSDKHPIPISADWQPVVPARALRQPPVWRHLYIFIPFPTLFPLLLSELFPRHSSTRVRPEPGSGWIWLPARLRDHPSKPKFIFVH